MHSLSRAAIIQHTRLFAVGAALLAAVVSGCGDDDGCCSVPQTPVGEAPGGAQNLSCPASAPAADPSVDSVLLPTLNAKVNRAWPSAAAAIDPLTFDSGPQTSKCPSNGGTDCFFGAGLVDCDHTTSDFKISDLTGLAGLSFSMLEASTFDSKDVATHSESGPDAGKITDGVFAPEGTTWNHPSYAVVPPLPGVGHALSVDLGSVVTICGNNQCGPKVQADRHPFQVEYSTDGTTWVTYSTVPPVSGDGLRTRSLASIVSGQQNPDFSARYVRLYGLPADDTNYSVSEVQLRNPAGQLLSVDQPAVGPRPYQIADGVVAPEGTTWNNKSYAAILRKDGSAHALVIDLGSPPVDLCGNSACGPLIQADKNSYQVDFSLDGLNWVAYAELPSVSGTGLRTRALAQRISGSDNPPFTARYVRVWGLSGDGNYSVSEITLRNTAGVIVAAKQTFGPEPLATDGELAPEGADWNDPRYANILSPCTTASSSICPAASRPGLTAPLPIDLTASFPISELVIQADRYEYQVDYFDESTHVWRALWTVPRTSGSGLRTRPKQTFAAPLPEARYLLIYGTAGDDLNYSVSSVQVTTAKAKTPCAAASGADSGQAFSCSYDGPLATEVSVPSAGLPITFTAEASAYLRCSSGSLTGSTPSTQIIPSGTTCTGLLSPTAPATGYFCSGTCASGTPPSALTLAELTDLELEVTDIACSHSLDSDVINGLAQVVAAGSAHATSELFNGLVVNPQAGPMVPSAICK